MSFEDGALDEPRPVGLVTIRREPEFELPDCRPCIAVASGLQEQLCAAGLTTSLASARPPDRTTEHIDGLNAS